MNKNRTTLLQNIELNAVRPTKYFIYASDENNPFGRCLSFFISDYAGGFPGKLSYTG